MTLPPLPPLTSTAATAAVKTASAATTPEVTAAPAASGATPRGAEHHPVGSCIGREVAHGADADAAATAARGPGAAHAAAAAAAPGRTGTAGTTDRLVVEECHPGQRDGSGGSHEQPAPESGPAAAGVIVAGTADGRGIGDRQVLHRDVAGIDQEAAILAVPVQRIAAALDGQLYPGGQVDGVEVEWRVQGLRAVDDLRAAVGSLGDVAGEPDRVAAGGRRIERGQRLVELGLGGDVDRRFRFDQGAAVAIRDRLQKEKIACYRDPVNPIRRDGDVAGGDGRKLNNIGGPKPGDRGNRAGIEGRAVPAQFAGAFEHNIAAAAEEPPATASVLPASMVEPPV